MKVYNGLEEVPADFGPSVVTIGKFDGVHLGHEKVIERLRADGLADSLTATVVTFDRNPLSVLAPQKCPPDLVSNAQKLELLEASGVEATVILEFTRAFSENTPREFVEGMLVNSLHAKIVLVGEDFRFGHFGAGNVSMLREFSEELGFRVELLETFDLPDAASGHGDTRLAGIAVLPADEMPVFSGLPRRRVSSTWVRELLGAGDVNRAGRLLGRNPIVRSRVVGAASRGEGLGIQTVTLAAETEGILPADGVYATWAVVDGSRYPAATSIGETPATGGGTNPRIEASLLAGGEPLLPSDLDGKSVELHFVERLRGALITDLAKTRNEQIVQDFARVRELLPKSVPPKSVPTK